MPESSTKCDFEEAPIWVDDTSGFQFIKSNPSQSEEVKSRNKLSLVVVDYLQPDIWRRPICLRNQISTYREA